eukprot:m.294664 g.294664  ORF g.294664 m.294664 type:complete len:73 (-) comp55142_c0_seq1:197-415(-)
MCASSMPTRQPCIEETAYVRSAVAPKCDCFCVTGLSRNAPILYTIKHPQWSTCLRSHSRSLSLSLVLSWNAR